MPQDQFYNNYFSPENLMYASHKWSYVQEICGKALNTVDFCFCVFHVHGQKQYYLSDRDYLFRSCMDSCIFWNIFSTHFPTDFFKTKVYLFTQTFSFAPSINTVSFDNSPASSNRLTIW